MKSFVFLSTVVAEQVISARVEIPVESELPIDRDSDRDISSDESVDEITTDDKTQYQKGSCNVDINNITFL